MEADYVIYSQISLLAGEGQMSFFLSELAGPIMIMMIVLAALVDIMSGNFVRAAMVMSGAAIFHKYEAIASLFGLPEQEKDHARHAPVGHVTELFPFHDMIFLALKTTAFLMMGILLLISVWFLISVVRANWRGWFEFRVSVISLAIRFLYWKLGIRDPLARVMVAIERTGTYEPLSFPETVAAAAVEHQSWMPWTGIVGDNGTIPSDYELVEVTMFDREGILDVDPMTMPYNEPVEGLYWRGVAGTEICPGPGLDFLPVSVQHLSGAVR